MRPSRICKYKTNRRKEVVSSKSKLKNQIKKMLILCTLTGTTILSTSNVFADAGITGYLQKWYSERVAEVEDFLIFSIETEATSQKAELLREVRMNTEQSVKELQKYAEEKQLNVYKNLEEKKKETMGAIDSNNQADIELTKQLLDEQIEMENNKDTDEVNNTDELSDEKEKEAEKETELVVDPKATNN